MLGVEALPLDELHAAAASQLQNGTTQPPTRPRVRIVDSVSLALILSRAPRKFTVLRLVRMREIAARRADFRAFSEGLSAPRHTRNKHSAPYREAPCSCASTATRT